jgi:hypothetical protein
MIMAGLLTNKPTESGYHSIDHDVTLGDILEIFINDSPDAEDKERENPIRVQSICGYVSGIYIKTGDLNNINIVIDLSPANPLVLLRDDCSKERIDAIFSVETKAITHYRKIDPAP